MKTLSPREGAQSVAAEPEKGYCKLGEACNCTELKRCDEWKPMLGHKVLSPELTQRQIDQSYEHHCVATNPYAPSRKYWGRAMQSGYDLAHASISTSQAAGVSGWQVGDRVINDSGEIGTVTHVDPPVPARIHVHFSRGLGDCYAPERLAAAPEQKETEK